MVVQASGSAALAGDILTRVENGDALEDAVASVSERDPLFDSRQLAVLLADGSSYVATGGRCLAHAGHARAVDAVAAANLMARPGVADAMLEAVGAHTGDLAAGLLAALRRAHELGGDLRGQQSASLLVLPAHPSGRALVDLRVDHAEQPLDLIQDALAETRAAALLDEGRQAGSLPAAVELFEQLVEIDVTGQSTFWFAFHVLARRHGDVGRAKKALEPLVRADPRLAETLRRAPDPVAAALLAAIS